MPELPKSQQIIDAIITRLALINGTGDYFTKLENVADSQPNWDEEQGELPAISVFEGRTATEEAPNERRKSLHVTPLMLKGFIKRGTSAAEARNLIADIKRAILGDGSQENKWLDERWPDANSIGLAMVTREKGSGIEYAEDTFEVTGVQVEIEVLFITGKFAGN